MYAVQKDVWHLTKFEKTIVEHFGTDALWVPIPERIKSSTIKELRLIPRNGKSGLTQLAH